MKVIAYRAYGSTEVLRVEDLPSPSPKAGQVLVQVHAASVNPVDWKIRRGELKLLSGRRFPRVPGIDFAGVVVRIGGGVDRFRVGDEVFGVLNAITAHIGSSAEYLAAGETQMSHKPAGVSFMEAASIPCAGLTAWHALRDLAQLRSGQRVLVNGASGGVGSFAVQIAKDMGASVTGTAGADNLEFVRGLGADQAIDYRTQDVRGLDERFDAIFDASAKMSYSATKHLLTRRGVFVTTLPSADVVLGALATFILPGRKAKIVVLNGRESIPKALTDLAGLVRCGRLRSVVGATFPLQDLAAAHALSETGHVRGKIGIQIV